MANAGRILIMPKGDWVSETTYESLDLVKHNGTSWLAKKTSIGIEPSITNKDYWQDMIDLNVIEEMEYTNEYLVAPVRFTKKNGIVSVTYNGDWKVGTPKGDIGILFNVDKKFRPTVTVYALCLRTSGETYIQIIIKENGDISAYNYGPEVTELSAGRFSTCYVSKS